METRQIAQVASQNASVSVSSKIASRPTSKLLNEVFQPHRLFHPGLQLSPVPSYHSEPRQKNDTALPELDHYPNFLRDP